MLDPRPVLLITFEPKFPLGRLSATPGALAALPIAEMQNALNRHANCDWGLLDEQDRAESDRALRNGTNVLSAYESSTGVRFWIITEHDRSATTILLPMEY